MIHLPHILSAVLLVSGVALVLCSRYLLERAHRCEISTRAGVAALLGAEGAISLMLAFSSYPVWWGTAACAALTASMAWLVIGTRYGRRCAQIDGWGITQPDELPVDAAGQQHEVQR
jgi:hypothetical protein